MQRLVMSSESMTIQWLDPKGDYIPSTKCESIFVIADTNAKDKDKEE